MKLMEAIEKRKSVRRFSDKAPDWRKILRAIDAARYAPSAGGYFVTKFILVSDSKKIVELAAASQQDFVGKAKYVVVVVTDDSALVRSYDERGVRYATQQSGAAIQNFLLALTEEKLATTWVGHFVDEQVKRVLDISEGLYVEAIFPIGIETAVGIRYSVVGSRRKTRLDNILFFDKWGNKQMVPSVKLSREAV